MVSVEISFCGSNILMSLQKKCVFLFCTCYSSFWGMNVLLTRRS